jgi:uncharacterized protein (TIGR02996 family)
MNATQRALLKAVAAAPQDDAPRLVYADWLDEHAAELSGKERESTAARAEIIRVQCELARLAEEDCDSRWVYDYLDAYHRLGRFDNPLYLIDWSEVDPGLARRLALRSTENRLMNQYFEEWQKTDCPVVKGVRFKLRRGFWTHIDLSGAKDIGRTVQALEKHPDLIPACELHREWTLTPEEARRVARSPVFRHLVGVSGPQPPVLFTALAQAKVAPAMRWVVANCYFDNVFAPFARSARWAGLRELFVWLPDGAPNANLDLEPVAGAEHLSELQSLQLNSEVRYNPATIIEMVANGVWKNLRRLNFNSCIRDESAIALSRRAAFKHLRSIDLSGEVGGRGASALLSSTNLKELVVIALPYGGQHGIQGLNASALEKARRPNLRVLDLPVSEKADVLAVANSPATRNVQFLYIYPRNDAAAKAFFRAMQMPQLVMWAGCGYDSGPASAEAIAQCDRLTNLQVLNLARTTIGDAGAKALAKSKHLGKLRHLDVSEAGVTASGLDALRKRFGEDAVRA